jgi:hypothetical protein
VTEIKYGVGVLPTPDKGASGQGFPEAMLSYLKGLSPRFGSLIVPDHISSLTGSSEGYYILEARARPPEKLRRAADSTMITSSYL